MSANIASAGVLPMVFVLFNMVPKGATGQGGHSSKINTPPVNNMQLTYSEMYVFSSPGFSIVQTNKTWSNTSLKLTLVFAGAYLFSITVSHILPELYVQAGDNAMRIGIYVLAGFFIQQFLEYLTAGVEHGHMHEHNENHDHGTFSSLFVMTGLCLHAFLEKH